MLRPTIVLALAATTATTVWANPQANAQAVGAIRTYYAVLHSTSDDMSSVVTALKPVMKTMSGKTAASVVRVLDRGFQKKYKKGTEFHRSLCECLAAGGKRGIATLARRYKADKRESVRLEIINAFAACGDKLVVPTLLKGVYDKDSDVASTAVSALAQYAKTNQKKRKSIAKTLVKVYSDAESKAAGKPLTSKERVRLDRLKGPLQATLTAYCNGEAFTNAAAWDAWLKENITQSWAD